MKIPRWLSISLLTLPWLGAVVLIGWFLVLRFPPSGVAHFSFPLDGSAPWFDPFLPGQRVSPPGQQIGGWVGQRILGDPVYATARVPGVFDHVDVTLETKPTHQPLLEFGILRDAENFSFQLEPVWSEVLSHGWRRVVHGDWQGFVKEGLPDETLWTSDADHLLTWHANVLARGQMDQTDEEKSFDVSLRGTHDFYVIPTDGEILFHFAIQDVNRSRGGNVAVFHLRKGDETVWTDAVSNSGQLDHRPDQVYDETVHVQHLSAGIYHLTFTADENIFIRHISTTAKRWVVGPRVYFGDRVGYSTTTQAVRVWTNSRHTTLETLHPEGRQMVSLGSATINLAQTHQPYFLDRTTQELDGPRVLTAPLGDVRVIGDGFFAFSPEALFLPSPRRLTDASRPEQEGIVAIVTSYQLPEVTADGWLRLHAAFDLSADQDRPKFTLSSPGISSRQGSVDIRAVELTFERPALSWNEWWKVLRQELVAAWKRL